MSKLRTDPEVSAVIGKNICDLRWRAKLHNGELAQAAGVSDSTITLIEQGKRTPSIAVLLNLKLALGATWDELLKGVEDA